VCARAHAAAGAAVFDITDQQRFATVGNDAVAVLEAGTANADRTQASRSANGRRVGKTTGRARGARATGRGIIERDALAAARLLAGPTASFDIGPAIARVGSPVGHRTVAIGGTVGDDGALVIQRSVGIRRVS